MRACTLTRERGDKCARIGNARQETEELWHVCAPTYTARKERLREHALKRCWYENQGRENGPWASTSRAKNMSFHRRVQTCNEGDHGQDTEGQEEEQVDVLHSLEEGRVAAQERVGLLTETQIQLRDEDRGPGGQIHITQLVGGDSWWQG